MTDLLKDGETLGELHMRLDARALRTGETYALRTDATHSDATEALKAARVSIEALEARLDAHDARTCAPQREDTRDATALAYEAMRAERQARAGAVPATKADAAPAPEARADEDPREAMIRIRAGMAFAKS